MGVARFIRPIFLKFCPNHIFEIDEARHFKFRVFIDKQSCMRYITPEKDVFRVT